MSSAALLIAISLEADPLGASIRPAADAVRRWAR